MQFFQDFKVDPNLRVGITSLLSNITTRPGSHKGGWTRLLKCQLFNLGYKNVTILNNKDSLINFDVIIFDLGAEYSGTLNLFGGLDEKVYTRLKEIQEYSGELFSWRNELADVRVLKSRKANTSTCEAFKAEPDDFLDQVHGKLSGCRVFDHAFRTEYLIIGDSHTPSVWAPSMMIERRDGRTLDGMLKNKTIDKYVQKFKEAGIELKHITVHCSSIDIRHHIARLEKPEETISLMAVDLANQLAVYGIPFELVHSVGIEDESRDLPKTGYFKGTAFYGNWAKRNVLRQIFNATLEECAKIIPNVRVVHFPSPYFDQDGKLKFSVMEVPGSVHLSPEYYRWHFERNENRWGY